MNSFLNRYRYFSWKAFWKMVFSPFKTVSAMMGQEKELEQKTKDLDKISHGTKSFSIADFVYVRKDIYTIDPVPIIDIYEEMKLKEKTFVRSKNLLAMWKAIKGSVGGNDGVL